ncbi:geranylgeranyl diphosphate synthase type II [Peptoniphilus koenoeneniae]|uniref:Geranylgeranyl diphosphate synthase type II n=1 Tax=Peptoniphilus koenoeneniae TaxID=507751 RepID=A0ABU0ASK5_9FIRM|nr:MULTISPECIES: polyprenyl synthetase family protein [Peptoniphilus]ERT56752.1 polyprenyl synthetase [Peptoniphilus sp. BV3C26]MDQ0274178.1 geranylgeranyl diphosphate synthase type II [Peptoniphilus koenoeneniae]
MSDYENLIKIIDENLYNSIPNTDDYQKIIYESIKYSLSSGGKRIRPLLTLISYKIFSGDNSYEKIIPYACAIEYIHTYSLIHDDLPGMDNDDMRRGKPTNHKVYNEAVAILAGDGLLNLAAETISKRLDKLTDLDEIKNGIKAMKYIFTCSGIQGMVAGQTIDIGLKESDMSRDVFESMYRLKTGALIRAALVCGAIIAGADDSEIIALERYGNSIGLAYQVKDDILDYESDINSKNMTLSRILNKDELKDFMQEIYQETLNSLKTIDRNTNELLEIAKQLMNRSY